MDRAEWWFKILFFALLGMGLENIWTGIYGFIKNRDVTLRGYSNVWVLPVYGIGAWAFGFFIGVLQNAAWWVRGLIYVVLIYAIDYLANFTIERWTGANPWPYEGRLHINHRINLAYFPLWFVFGFMVEFFHFFLE